MRRSYVERELEYIALTLGMINDILRNCDDHKHKIIATRYMNKLQDYGCRLRLVEGNIVLIDYNPMILSRL